MKSAIPFGKYLLLDRISVGGMAEVFRARRARGDDELVAIKRILPTTAEDPAFIKMLVSEARTAAQLTHPNICKIFELGRTEGIHFIAMEHIWGKDLLQIHNRLRALDQSMAIPVTAYLVMQVLDGLEHAHRKRDPLGRPLELVHRDCSPQNILVSYDGDVKLIDFGIAKVKSRISSDDRGTIKGKYAYMSPEQAHGAHVDRRCDIFAIGIVLYECVTSQPVYTGDSDFLVLEKVRSADIQPPREIMPNIPTALEMIIMRALAPAVEDRYEWCSDMRRDLERFAHGVDRETLASLMQSWFAREYSDEHRAIAEYTAARPRRPGETSAPPPPALEDPAAGYPLGRAESADAFSAEPTATYAPKYEEFKVEDSTAAPPEGYPFSVVPDDLRKR